VLHAALAGREIATTAVMDVPAEAGPHEKHNPEDIISDNNGTEAVMVTAADIGEEKGDAPNQLTQLRQFLAALLSAV